jgi:predicted aldo/keto reductase-like oxidoreductase
MAKLSRRHFLSALPTGILGLGLGNKTKGNYGDYQQDFGENSPPKVKKYNTLGNTGLKVSDVSCGAISFFEPTVLRYAYDLGVNYFDTAEGYMRQKSEAFVGEALKDVRDKLIITTKHGYSARDKSTKESIIKRMEDSLKRMQTDYVDFALTHGVDNLKLLENEELRAAYDQLKKDGKVRYTGFSSHNPKVTLKQALDNDFVQLVLVIYNHDEGKEIEPLLKQVRQKGIATVAMKIFAGGKQGNLKSLVNHQVSYPQAAIRWVMSNPDVDTCIPTMSSYSHVEEYVAASGQPLSRADLEVISEYQRQTYDQYCRVSCSECLASCPQSVAINDVLRYKMYFEDYKMEKESMQYYAELEDEKKPDRCSECAGLCEKACPFGLKVKEKLIQAHEILSV